MASKASKALSNVNNASSEEDLCVVCFKEAKIYSIGSCDHPVCYECSARMRVLCENKECPICRSELESVIFMSKQKPFRNINSKSMKLEHRYQIYFENDKVMSAYDRLMEHKCSLCKNNQSFRSFFLLRKHMKEHELHYCEICVENLKIFSHERKAYSRSDLIHHKKKGDLDDTSHRGHPQCTFCNSRFVDRDDLFRHLRREHYYCHFCELDTPGSHEYYCDYEDLREHFLKNHFLCEEDDCKNERFTTVFRTKIDLQAHWTQTHSHTATRQQIRSARTVELDFLQPRRSDNHSERNRGRYGTSNRRTNQDIEDQERAAAALPPTIPSPPPPATVNISCAEDFPSLGAASAAMSNLPNGNSTSSSKQKQNKSIAQKVAHEQRFSVRMGGQLRPEDFPALGQSTSSQGTTQNSFIQRQMAAQSRAAAAATPTSSQPKSKISTVVAKTPQNKKSTKPTTSRQASMEDFPSLVAPQTNQQPASWVKPTKQKPKPAPKKPPPPKNPSNFTVNDFPSLNPSNETKKMMQNLSNKKVQMPKKKESYVSGEKAGKSVTSTTSVPLAGKDLGKKTKVKRWNPDEDDGLPVDLSMSREGDYQSVVGNLSSNIALVQMPSNPIRQAAPTEVKNIRISLDKPSEDFPSLGGNSVPDVNSNWVATKAVKSKPAKSKKENRKPSPAIVSNANESFEYIPPDNFEHRNRSLLDTLQLCCYQQIEKMNKFKSLADLLRKGQLSYTVYYNQCKSVLGKGNFHAILPELLALLPHIKSQQGIYEAYMNIDNGLGCGCDLHLCPTCGQVLVEDDVISHLEHHKPKSRKNK